MKRNNLFQTTLRSSFSLTGLGAFTGKKVTINCRPAKEDGGIVFVTKDGRIKADWRNIRLSKRHFHTTELAENGASITTTERIKGEAILYKPSHALSREVAEKIARAEEE